MKYIFSIFVTLSCYHITITMSALPSSFTVTVKPPTNEYQITITSPTNRHTTYQTADKRLYEKINSTDHQLQWFTTTSTIQAHVINRLLNVCIHTQTIQNIHAQIEKIKVQTSLPENADKIQQLSLQQERVRLQAQLLISLQQQNQ